MQTLPHPAINKNVVPLPGRTVGGVPVRQRRPATKRDLSVIMILLAAETVACVSREEAVSTDMLSGFSTSMSAMSQSSNNNSTNKGSSTQQRTAMSGRLGSSSSSSSSSTPNKNRSQTHKGIPPPSSPQDDETTSSGGDTESDETGAITPSSEEVEELMTPTVVAKDNNVKVCNLSISSYPGLLPPGMYLQAATQHRSSAGALLGKNSRVMAEVFSFLSWREVIQVRAASREWLRSSLSSATVCRLPNSKTRAVFVPCTQDLSENDETLEASLISGNSHDWSCPVCGMYNMYSRIQCANSSCSSLSPAHWTAKRIFLGQLRRESTVSFVQWLFNRIMDINPVEALVSVENHRDRETGRGKGCAWVSINKKANVEKLLAIHHRALYDTYEEVEGMWIVHPKDVGALAKRPNAMHNNVHKNRRNNNGSASPSRSYWDWRQHAQHMPRSPIVAEATVDQESPKALFMGPGNLSLNTPQHFSVNPKTETVVVRHNPYYRCEAVPEMASWNQMRYHKKGAFNKGGPNRYTPTSSITTATVVTPPKAVVEVENTATAVSS